MPKVTITWGAPLPQDMKRINALFGATPGAATASASRSAEALRPRAVALREPGLRNSSISQEERVLSEASATRSGSR